MSDDEPMEIDFNRYIIDGQLHRHGDRWYVFGEEGKRDLTSILENLAGSDVRITAITMEDLQTFAEAMREGEEPPPEDDGGPGDEGEDR